MQIIKEPLFRDDRDTRTAIAQLQKANRGMHDMLALFQDEE